VLVLVLVFGTPRDGTLEIHNLFMRSAIPLPIMHAVRLPLRSNENHFCQIILRSNYAQLR